MANPPRRRLRSINETAESLGVSRASIYRLHNKGVLPFVKIAGRSLIDDDDIESVISDGKKRQA